MTVTSTLALSENAINPLESWDLREVLATDAGVPRNDLYGKLFFHVRGLFEKFIVRLQSLKVDFDIHMCEGADLPRQLAGIRFDRIVVSEPLERLFRMTKSTLYRLLVWDILKPWDRRECSILSVRFSNLPQTIPMQPRLMCTPRFSVKSLTLLLAAYAIQNISWRCSLFS